MSPDSLLSSMSSEVLLVHILHFVSCGVIVFEFPQFSCVLVHVFCISHLVTTERRRLLS